MRHIRLKYKQMQANMIQIQANARKDLRIQADTTCEYNKYKQIQAQIHYFFLHGQKGTA